MIEAAKQALETNVKRGLSNRDDVHCNREKFFADVYCLSFDDVIMMIFSKDLISKN